MPSQTEIPQGKKDSTADYDKIDLPKYALEQSTLLALILLASSILWGIGVPATIAFTWNVFSEDELRLKIPTDAKTKLEEYDYRRASLKARIQKADNQLDIALKTGSTSNVSALLQLKNARENELAALRTPIVLQPFFPGMNNIFLPCNYFFLGVLLFIIPPLRLKHRRIHWQGLTKFEVVKYVLGRWLTWARDWRRLVVFAVLIFALYRWPTWARNSVWRDVGRTAYTDANFDICPVMFIWQEVSGLIIAFMLAAIWLRHMDALSQIRRFDFKHPSIDWATDALLIKNMSERLLLWQITSVVLACAYIPLTTYFYDVIFGARDYRYAAAAIMVHACWAMTWLIVSCPLFYLHYRWSSAKLSAIAELRKSGNPPSSEVQLNLLQELRPFTFANAATSGVLAVIAFFFPILQTILHGK